MEAKQTQQFFSDTAKGLNKPNRNHKPIVKPTNKNIYYFLNIFSNEFDSHIDTSIPYFLENKLFTIAAIQATFRRANILDIGSSSGAFGATLAYLNNTYTINVIEPNENIAENISLTNFKHYKQCFNTTFDDIPIFNTHFKYEIIRESMTFQFMGLKRIDYLQEVKRRLTSDGIFLTEEKFNLENETFYQQNEKLKNSFKSKYYSKEQLNKKEDVLIGMRENQYDYNKYVFILSQMFTYVELYYRSGNFRGLIATDSLEKLNLFMNEMKSQSLLQDNLYCTRESYSFQNDLTTMQDNIYMYNHLVKKSKFVLDEADYNNISICLTCCNNLAFAMIDIKGNFCHLYKYPAIVFDNFVNESVNQRLENLTNIKPTLNTFNFKNREEDMKKLGFRVVKRVPFNEELAGFKAEGITAVLYMEYDPEYEPSWFEKLIISIKTWWYTR